MKAVAFQPRIFMGIVNICCLAFIFKMFLKNGLMGRPVHLPVEYQSSEDNENVAREKHTVLDRDEDVQEHGEKWMTNVVNPINTRCATDM